MASATVMNPTPRGRFVLNPALSEFLTGIVRSVWAVELLLVLRRTPNEGWTSEALVRELRGSPSLVADIVAVFGASGLLQETQPGLYTYAPASPLLDSLCEELEREYKRRPVTIIRALATPPTDKVQGLANAFRFKETDK